MEVIYKLKNGEVITSPTDSEYDFWVEMRNGSKFESDMPVAQYRLGYIDRVEITYGFLWHEMYERDDMTTLRKYGEIL